MVAVANPGGQFPVPNGALPCEGTKVYPFLLDFTGGKNAYSIDLTSQYNQKQFTTLQTIFVDNSTNPAPLQIVCSTTNQIVTAPPLSQGYYAILQPSPPKFIVQTNGGVSLYIQILNFYIPPVVWNVPVYSAGGLPEIDIPALDAVIVGGRVQVLSTPAPVTFTDASGTIAAGATGQVLTAANAAGQRVILQNPTAATEILQWSINSIVGPWFDLAAGQAIDESKITNGFWVRSLTAGHAFTAAVA